MMLNIRRLTALTALRLIGSPNLTGHAPVAVVATSLPPDLVTLQLAESSIPEVGKLSHCARCRRVAVCLLAAVSHVLQWQLMWLAFSSHLRVGFGSTHVVTP